jgi:hypothetical protein
MKKLASSLFLAVLLLSPVAAPASAATRDHDGGAITKFVRFVKAFFGAHSLGDQMSPPLP